VLELCSCLRQRNLIESDGEEGMELEKRRNEGNQKRNRKLAANHVLNQREAIRNS
jgi:hypothetical protein